MILTDREIQVAITTDQLSIEPPPLEEHFSSSSLDLTLDETIRMWKKPEIGVEQIISPAEEGYNYLDVAKRHTEMKTIPEEGLVFAPGEFLLAWTQQIVRLPVQSRLAARVEGKSSIARLGIAIHLTAPTIHAGFHGPIQLEVCNNGPLKVRLTPGMPICQLILEQTLGTPEKGYAGRFQRQSRQ